MMLNKILSTSVLVVLILNRSVASHPAISDVVSDKAENNDSDNKNRPKGILDSSRFKIP